MFIMLNDQYSKQSKFQGRIAQSVRASCKKCEHLPYEPLYDQYFMKLFFECILYTDQNIKQSEVQGRIA